MSGTSSSRFTIRKMKWFSERKFPSKIRATTQVKKPPDCQIWNGSFVSSPPSHRLAAADPRNIHCWENGNGARFLLCTIWRNSTLALDFCKFLTNGFSLNETNLLIYENWKPIFAPIVVTDPIFGVGSPEDA